MTMGEIRKTPGLRYSQEEKNTWAGMAHFAGTGPPGKTCRECEHWAHAGYNANGTIMRAACEKFQKMMPAAKQQPFPHYLRACKYFVSNPRAPTVHRGDAR
jgi:hypothetical protein